MKLPQVNPPEADKPAGSYKRKACPPLAGLFAFGGIKFLSPSPDRRDFPYASTNYEYDLVFEQNS